MSGQLWWQVFFVSLFSVAGTTSVYFWSLNRGNDLEHARTLVVNALVVMQIFYLFSVRYLHGVSLTWRGVLGTPAIRIGVTTVVLAQFAFTYLPWFNAAFGTQPLSLLEGAIVMVIGVAMFLLTEVEKPVRRRLLARLDTGNWSAA